MMLLSKTKAIYIYIVLYNVGIRDPLSTTLMELGAPTCETSSCDSHHYHAVVIATAFGISWWSSGNGTSQNTLILHQHAGVTSVGDTRCTRSITF